MLQEKQVISETHVTVTYKFASWILVVKTLLSSKKINSVHVLKHWKQNRCRGRNICNREVGALTPAVTHYLAHTWLRHLYNSHLQNVLCMRTQSSWWFKARISLLHINSISVSIRNCFLSHLHSSSFGHPAGLSDSDKITFLKGQWWVCTMMLLSKMYTFYKSVVRALLIVPEAPTQMLQKHQILANASKRFNQSASSALYMLHANMTLEFIPYLKPQ